MYSLLKIINNKINLKTDFQKSVNAAPPSDKNINKRNTATFPLHITHSYLIKLKEDDPPCSMSYIHILGFLSWRLSDLRG